MGAEDQFETGNGRGGTVDRTCRAPSGWIRRVGLSRQFFHIFDEIIHVYGGGIPTAH